MLRYLVLAGALCASGAPFLSGGVSRVEADTAVIWLVIGVVVVALVGVVGRRRARVVAAVAGVGLAVQACRLLVRDLLTGLPGDDLPVLAVGSLAVAVGVIGLAARRDRVVGKPVQPRARTSPAPQPPAEGSAGQVTEGPAEQQARTGDSPQPHAEGSAEQEALADAPAQPRTGPVWAVIRWRPRPFGVLAVVVVAVAAVFAPTAAEAVVVRSEVREAWDSPPRPLPERPGERWWTWQSSADVVDVVAAGHGVAVATADGFVVGLNGVGGQEEWRYGRPGVVVERLAGSPDGRTVVVVFGSRHDRSALELAVLLDAETGAPRFERVVRSTLDGKNALRPGSRTLTVRDENGVTGYDIADGEPRWRWELPEGCSTYGLQDTWGRTTVLVPMRCTDDFHQGVLALDEVTGQERWRHEITAIEAARAGLDKIEVEDGFPGGAAVLLRLEDHRPGGMYPESNAVVTRVLLDAETGTALAPLDLSSDVRTEFGVTPLVERVNESHLRAVDPNTGVTAPFSYECAAPRAHATTSTTFYNACVDESGWTLVTQPLDGSPPTYTPIRPDGWDSSPSGPDVHLVIAPGAIVIERDWNSSTSDPAVVGLEG